MWPHIRYDHSYTLFHYYMTILYFVSPLHDVKLLISKLIYKFEYWVYIFGTSCVKFVCTRKHDFRVISNLVWSSLKFIICVCLIIIGIPSSFIGMLLGLSFEIIIIIIWVEKFVGDGNVEL